MKYFSIRYLIITIYLIPYSIFADLKVVRAFNNPNEVTALAEMDSNIVWTTSNCGLSRWDLSTGEVITYNKRNSPLPRDYASHVTIRGDTIWVTSGKRLFRIIDDEWTSYTWQDIGMPFEYDFDLVTYDNWGRLWVSFSYGVAYYDDGNWTYFDENNSTLYPYIKSMEPGIDGDMWFGHTRLWVHNLSQYTLDGNWIPHDGFYYPQQIAVEPDGQVWIERDSRIGVVQKDTIYILNAEHAHWSQYRHSLFEDIWAIDTGLRLRSGHKIYHKNLGSMDIEQIWSFPDSLPWVYFLEQSEQHDVYFKVWDSFITLGFIKLTPTFSWTWYQTQGELENNLVEALFLGPNNKVYVGKYAHQIKYYSDGINLKRSENIIRYPHNINDSLFAWNGYNDNNIYFSNGKILTPIYNVWDFDISDDRTLYFLSDGANRGVYYLNEKNEPIQLKNCPMTTFRYICVDNNSNVWISDYNWEGTAVYDGYEWDFYKSNDPRVAQGNIDLFYVDSWGRVWCATNNSWPNYGLSMYDGQKWHIYNSANGLPTPSIEHFAEDAFGNIWMATGLGLVKYNGYSFEVFDHTNTELPSPWVKSLVIDNTGNFWVGTSNGLFVLNNTGEYVYDLPQDVIASDLSIKVESGHPVISWKCGDIPDGFAGFHLEKSRYGNKFTRIATFHYSQSNSSYSVTDTTTKYGCMFYRLVEYDDIGRRWTSLTDSVNLEMSINVHLSEILKYEDEDSIHIKWHTNSPNDIKFFALYRQPSEAEWEFVTKIPSLFDTSYCYIDNTDSLTITAYKIKAITYDGIEFISNDTTVTIVSRPPIQLPNGFALSNIYPNPTNSNINIDFNLPENTEIILTIYNILGQQVKRLETGIMPNGYQSLNINTGTLSSGIYILYIDKPFQKIYKFTLLK
ncbi:MAG: T9SS type A sorting domain-containing protein [Candidatus Cloacimonetes bacterium]|nr:T9SS type A sorting domain-containing protein [Candidatus Cloacimonadota bacterium]